MSFPAINYCRVNIILDFLTYQKQPSIKVSKSKEKTTFLLLCGLFFISTSVSADFEIVDLQSKIEGRTIISDVNFDLRLNEKTKDALNNGITIAFKLEFSLQKIRQVLWNERLIKKQHLFFIRYQALSNRFILSADYSPKSEYYESAEEALRGVNEYSPFLLTIPDKIKPDSNKLLLLSARIQLDIESLPAPLRPLAYLTPSWRLSSSWKQWQLEK